MTAAWGATQKRSCACSMRSRRTSSARATGRRARRRSRSRERDADPPMTTLEQLRERLPASAKDIKLNLSVLERGTKLDRLQLWGTAVATALATRNADLARTIVHEARAHLAGHEL